MAKFKQCFDFVISLDFFFFFCTLNKHFFGRYRRSFSCIFCLFFSFLICVFDAIPLCLNFIRCTFNKVANLSMILRPTFNVANANKLNASKTTAFVYIRKEVKTMNDSREK